MVIKTLNLKEGWGNMGLPIRIMKSLQEVGETIHKKPYWYAIEHLLKRNEEFIKFRQSKNFKEILNTGAIKEENAFFQELENIKENIKNLSTNMKKLWDKVERDEIKNPKKILDNKEN